MANEQTTVPLFVAAEVLTAADMNLSAGTGVPVFTNSTTRDAGFGGAGEKVLAEGQLCYLSDSNIVQYYDGAAWATVGPLASKIAQVVTARYATQQVSSTTTYADTGLSATITPTLNTSTILVMVNQGGCYKNAITPAGLNLNLLRGASSLIDWAINVGYNGTGVANFVGSACLDYLDSPATTSATTYKTQYKCSSTGSGENVAVQVQSTVSSIVLVELLA